MHSVIEAVSVSYYPVGAQVMTLVLPLGFFIVVMTALYFVFTRPHTIPGRHRRGPPRRAGRAGPGGVARGGDRPAHRDRVGRGRAAGRAGHPARGRRAHRGRDEGGRR